MQVTKQSSNIIEKGQYNNSQHQINKKVHQSYFFETETRRLKNYYLEHENQLINVKVLFNNSAGLVKYFGILKHQGASQSAEKWIGIQWDEPNRGKHNGTVKGYEYFKCQENRGSLIRFMKIQFGYRLQTALFRRYFRAQQLHHAKNIYDSLKEYKQSLKDEQQHVRLQKCESMLKKSHKVQYDNEAYVDTLKEGKKIMIEFIGFDEIWVKINNLEKLANISLAQCRICDIGIQGHLKNTLPNLRILSLEDNLLSQWDQVYQLGHQLTQLSELSISNNKLADPHEQYLTKKQIKNIGYDHCTNIIGDLFANLKSLVLINTGLTWNILMQIIPAFTHLIDLILCKNNLSDVQCIQLPKIQYFKTIKYLNLQETNLTQFSKLAFFSQLPNLQKLILNKNHFQQFGNEVSGFTKLRYLSVQGCSIVQPVAISQLSFIKNLQTLNIKYNPMSEKLGNSYIRQRAVAEFPTLKVINGAALGKYERKDCEIYYLRESFHEYFILKKVPDYDYDFDDFMHYCSTRHPNIDKLIKKFGNPYEVEKKQQIQDKIKIQVKETETKKGMGMCKMLLKVPHNGYEETKKIPLTWTLNSLKNFIARAMKIPVASQKLQCKVNFEAQAEEMTQDHKTLSYYHLSDESSIIIHRID